MTRAQQRKQHAFVIRQLTARELKRKYARSYLGIVWSVLNPLLSMAVLSLIFSQLFRRSIDNYPIYYLTGYILWQAFTGATTSAMTTLVDNKALLLKVKFPMELFVLCRPVAHHAEKAVPFCLPAKALAASEGRGDIQMGSGKFDCSTCLGLIWRHGLVSFFPLQLIHRHYSRFVL